MADFFLSNLKSTLDNCITELDEIHSMFCRNPESDFTRNRKLSFREYIQFMLQMQSKSVSNEILDFFEHSHVSLVGLCLRHCSRRINVAAPAGVISDGRADVRVRNNKVRNGLCLRV